MSSGPVPVPRGDEIQASEARAMVIVGAGIAGVTAALTLRQRGWEGAIELLGQEDGLPYERPPLSKFGEEGASDPDPKLLVSSSQFSDLGITYRPGRRVLSIDRPHRRVLTNAGEPLAYDRLLIATGARARTMDVPIAEGARIATLRTHHDAIGIRSSIGPGRTVAIVGGGFIGLEVAASATARGAAAVVLERNGRLLRRSVPPDIAEVVRAKHERMGVRIATNAHLERIDMAGGRSAVLTTKGEVVEADLVVVGIGAVPNADIAADCGLVVSNGIEVDHRLATSDPSVFAAGDCCIFRDRRYGRIRLESWRSAQRQGMSVACSMLGGDAAFDDVPWFWSDQYDDVLQMVGIAGEGDHSVRRELGGGGRIAFSIDGTGHLRAACGFGSLGAVAKEIRFAEKLIMKDAMPDPSRLSDPGTSLKSLLA